MVTYEPTVDGRSFCKVCGDGIAFSEPLEPRCTRHRQRHACAIEGCKRSSEAKPLHAVRSDAWICSEHWRRFCPPRSQRRRAYHWFFREAKRRGGFDDDLRTRFWRFWDTLIGSARARDAAGAPDILAINKAMGW